MAGRVPATCARTLGGGWPGHALRDSHKSGTFYAFKHGQQSQMTSDQHDWPRLAVISGPSAEAGADPRRMSERTGWVRVALACGASFEGLTDRLDNGLIGRLEDIRHRASGEAIAIVQH